MDIYQNIKEIADLKGLSIRQVEQQAGLSHGVIRRWGNREPSVQKVLNVARVLHVNIYRLLR